MIVLKDISKKLQNKLVLDEISFHIAKNESVGIIGLNGAGKTTLLNVMAGLIWPDHGFIRVGGTENVLENDQVRRDIAYVSGTKSQLWEEIRIKDSFSYCIKMYQIPEAHAKQRLEELAGIFEINDLLHSVPRSLSLGERMRCELVYALLSEPKILLLDEVMIGLDVSMKYKIMQYFERLRNEKKTTIIYTSHNLVEVEKLCDRIILIDKGRIIFDGSIERIMREFAPLYHLQVKVEDALPDFEDLPLEKIGIERDMLHIVYDNQKIDTAQILRHIMEKSKIQDVRLFEPDLEGTIKKIYERAE